MALTYGTATVCVYISASGFELCIYLEMSRNGLESREGGGEGDWIKKKCLDLSSKTRERNKESTNFFSAYVRGSICQPPG